MKKFLIKSLIVVSYLIAVSNGEEKKKNDKNRGDALAIETNSELVSSSQNVQAMLTQTSMQCSKEGSMCLTCRSVGMCKGGVMTEVQCRGLYPYCDARTGSCTNERRRCKEEERSMLCPSQGFFPDPQSCRAFHVCEGDPIVSYKLACATLQVYDHEEKKCTRPSFRVRCVSFACFGKQGRYTPYPSDHSIYTLCADAAATGIFKCPENQEFDESKQKCVASCTSEDNMPDKDDETCRKYYRCVKSGRKFDAVPSSCPLQRIFDENQLKCVPKTSDFKCNHMNQLAIATSTTTASAEKEESIGETEETFFRQNPSQSESKDKTSSNHSGKSASIIGSVIHKEVEINHTPSTKVTKDSSTNDKTTSPINSMTFQTTHNSHESSASVISMLTSENVNGADSHPPKQIVVRETNTDKPHTQSTSSHLNSPATVPTGQTYQVTTTEEIKTASSSLNNPIDTTLNTMNKMSVDDKITTNANIKPMVSIISGQTYKVTTDLPNTTENLVKLTALPVKPIVTSNMQDDLPTQEFNIDKEKKQGLNNIPVSSTQLPTVSSTNRPTEKPSAHLVTEAPKPNSHQILI